VALTGLLIGVHPVVDQAVVPVLNVMEVKLLFKPKPKLPGNPLWMKLKPEASETEISSTPEPRSVTVTVFKLLVPQPPVQSSEV
jgi:hypothetical protein